MALSSRELLLIIRARDMASRELNGVNKGLLAMGTAAASPTAKLMGLSAVLTTVGIGFLAAGVAGIGFFNDAANAATKYNQAAALTLTQVDTLGVSLEEIKTIGRGVAREVPAAFEQMQPALYDIFSSIDVTLNESIVLLDAFSRAAVAGQVEVQDASSATIGILNAWKMEIKDVHRVNDIMFQLVRKGVGTYDEFSSTIGRAVPSAVRAGQSVETLAGMLAFLTRNNMSAAMSSSSAARALESMVHPKVIERMEKMGVNVKNAQGEMRPMIDIVGQLRDKMSDLTGPERAKALQELFLGAGGTIQSRRFWDLALSNFDQLKARVSEMGNASGEMKRAYDIMFDQPQTQIQALTNQYEILKTEIGDKVIPIKLKLVKAALKVLDAWNNLSPKTQDLIVKIAMIGSVVLTVVGAFLLIAGAVLGFMALLSVAGVGLGAFAVGVGVVLVAIVALAGAAYLVYKNWDSIKSWLTAFWDSIVATWQSVWARIGDDVKGLRDKIVERWTVIANQVKDLASRAAEVLKKIWTDVKEWFGSLKIGDTLTHWMEKLKTTAEEIWPMLVEAFGHISNALAQLASFFVAAFGLIVETVSLFWNLWGDDLLSTLTGVWSGIKSVVEGGINVIAGVIKLVLSIINGDWSAAWDAIKQVVVGLWQVIYGIFKAALSILSGIVRAIVDAIVQPFKWLYNVLVGNSIIPDLINAIVDWFKSLPGKVVAFLVDMAIRGVQAATNMMNQMIGAISTGITTVIRFFQELPGKVLSALSTLAGYLLDVGLQALQSMLAGARSGWTSLYNWFTMLPGKILSAVGNLGSLLLDAGKNLIGGLIDGVESKVSDLTSSLGDVTDMIPDWKGPASKDAKLLYSNGQLIMQGLENGIISELPKVKNLLNGVTNNIPGMINAEKQVVGFTGLQADGSSLNGSVQITVAEGAIQLDFTGARFDNQDQVDLIQQMIDEALEELVRQLQLGYA